MSEDVSPVDTKGMSLEQVKEIAEARRLRSQTMYTFANAYGGVTTGTTPPQIHEYLRELRLATGPIAAVKGAAAFPTKSAKELMINMGQAATDLHMNVYPVDVEVQCPAEAPMFTGKNGPAPGTAATVRTTVRIVAPDGSFIDVKGVGGGLDRDDKACGKASTYAFKDGCLKGLGIAEKELLDADNESGHGADQVVAPKKGKAKPAAAPTEAPAAPATESPAAPEVTLESVLAGIAAATDGATLVAAASKGRALEKKDQNTASAAYRAKKTELGL